MRHSSSPCPHSRRVRRRRVARSRWPWRSAKNGRVCQHRQRQPGAGRRRTARQELRRRKHKKRQSGQRYSVRSPADACRYLDAFCMSYACLIRLNVMLSATYPCLRFTLTRHDGAAAHARGARGRTRPVRGLTPWERAASASCSRTKALVLTHVGITPACAELVCTRTFNAQEFTSRARLTRSSRLTQIEDAVRASVSNCPTELFPSSCARSHLARWAGLRLINQFCP